MGAKADDVAYQISRRPDLLSKVQEVASELTQRAQKAGPVDLLSVLIEHAPTYGIRNLSPEGYEALFTVYLRALEPLPLEAVKQAFVQWTRDGNGFFPKPEQIFQRAEPFAAELRMAAYRARKALEKQADRPRQMTPEEREADRKRAIEQGLLDADGKVKLDFLRKPSEPMPSRPHSQKADVAERLRRIADGLEPLPGKEPPPAVEEAI